MLNWLDCVNDTTIMWWPLYWYVTGLMFWCNSPTFILTCFVYHQILFLLKEAVGCSDYHQKKVSGLFSFLSYDLWPMLMETNMGTMNPCQLHNISPCDQFRYYTYNSCETYLYFIIAINQVFLAVVTLKKNLKIFMWSTLDCQLSKISCASNSVLLPVPHAQDRKTSFLSCLG